MVPNSDDLSKKETIEIGALTDFPAYYSAGYSPDLIVSDDYFEKIVQQPLIEMIKIDYKEAFSKNTEDSIMNLIKDSKVLSVDSKLSQYSDMKNSENQITVFGGKYRTDCYVACNFKLFEYDVCKYAEPLKRICHFRKCWYD